MANSKQATKRARQQNKQREHNVALKSEMRTYIKQVLQYIQEKALDNAKSSFQKAVSKLDRLAGNNLIHPNKAARIKSRLNAKLKAAGE